MWVGKRHFAKADIIRKFKHFGETRDTKRHTHCGDMANIQKIRYIAETQNTGQTHCGDIARIQNRSDTMWRHRI